MYNKNINRDNCKSLNIIAKSPYKSPISSLSTLESCRARAQACSVGEVGFRGRTYKTILAFLLSLLIVLLMLSCSGFDQEIIAMDVDVDNVPTILVINGEIERDSLVWVNLSYTEDIDAMADVPIKYENSATISLSTSSGENEKLDFVNTGTYVGNYLKGKVGETYTLSVTIGDQNYTATSTMLKSYGYDTAWVVAGTATGKEGSYSDEWRINDPSATRDRYLFEWWTNGVHIVLRDWAIDDNRVVNANEGLRLFTVTMNPGSNEHIRHRVARIEKMTYDYYNMYEKIVRKLIGVSSQTPYNPVSNFGEGTVGNFRAVDFSEYIILTPPGIKAVARNEKCMVLWNPNSVFAFKKYHLYWDTKPGITNLSNHVVKEITNKMDTTYIHAKRTNGATYYYKLAVEDSDGNISLLSSEAFGTPVNGLFEPYYVNVKNEDAQVVLTWEKCPVAEKYTIYWNTKPGVTDTSKKITNITDTFYTHTSLTNGQSYYYRVASLNAADSSSILSQEVRAIPNSITTAPGVGEIVISWGDVLGADADYYIGYDTIPTTLSSKPNYTGKVSSPYTHENLVSGKTYYYRVIYVFSGPKMGNVFYPSQEVSAIPD